MKITLLGTGSPSPSLRRASSGYLLEIGTDKIIVDMGPGSFRNLLKTGVKLDSITHFFLSHLHFDHCQDFLRLFHHRWDGFRESIPALKLFGPSGFQRFVDLQFGKEGAFGPDILSRLEHPLQKVIRRERTGLDCGNWPQTLVTELNEGDQLSFGRWTCSVDTVPHYEPFLINHGFRFGTERGVITYSSDVAVKYSTNVDDRCLSGIRRLAENADILVHYMNGVAIASDDPDAPPAGIRPALVGELAQKAGVKTLITTHHGPRMEGQEVIERVLTEIRSSYSGIVVWGEDLMNFEI